jgi:hypothetical protein
MRIVIARDYTLLCVDDEWLRVFIFYQPVHPLTVLIPISTQVEAHPQKGGVSRADG